MTFEVKSKREAEWYASAQHKEKSIIISFYGKNEEQPILPIENEKLKNGVIGVIFIQADDVDVQGNQVHYFFNGRDNGVMPLEQFNRLHNRRAFTYDDAIKICNFVTLHKDSVDKIIVHCRAGVSRSAGCCAAIMKSITGSDWDIFGNMKYHPNMYIYKKVLEAFFWKGYTGMTERRL